MDGGTPDAIPPGASHWGEDVMYTLYTEALLYAPFFVPNEPVADENNCRSIHTPLWRLLRTGGGP